MREIHVLEHFIGLSRWNTVLLQCANAVQTPTLLVPSKPLLRSCVPAWFLGIHRRACLRQYWQPFEQDGLHAAPPLGPRDRNKPFCHLRHHSPLSRSSLFAQHTGRRTSNRPNAKSPTSSLVVQQRRPHVALSPAHCHHTPALQSPQVPLQESEQPCFKPDPSKMYSAAVQARHRRMP